MRRVRIRWAVFAVALSLSAAPVTLVSSLGNSASGFAFVAGNAPLASSFSTGPSAFTLTSVVLMLGREDAGPHGSTAVNLYSDSGNSPGALLAQVGTLDDSAINLAPQNYTFTLATPYPLDANKRYWIGLTSVGDTIAVWGYTTPTSGGGTFLLQVRASPSAGPPSATTVPPPLTLTLVGLFSLAGLYFTSPRFAKPSESLSRVSPLSPAQFIANSAPNQRF